MRSCSLLWSIAFECLCGITTFARIWASSYAFSATAFEVIACRTAGQGSLHTVIDPREVNHWASCVKLNGGGLGNGVAEEEATREFQAFYFSLGRMVIPTVRDGDCGPDTMCTLLAMPRLLRERTRIRHELAGFLLKHSSNRALIGSMFGLAEVRKHLGLFELECRGCFALRGQWPRPW